MGLFGPNDRETRVSRDELVRRLESRVRTAWSASGGAPFVGQVAPDHAVIRVGDGFRRPFQPILYLSYPTAGSPLRVQYRLVSRVFMLEMQTNIWIIACLGFLALSLLLFILSGRFNLYGVHIDPRLWNSFSTASPYQRWGAGTTEGLLVVPFLAYFIITGLIDRQRLLGLLNRCLKD